MKIRMVVAAALFSLGIAAGTPAQAQSVIINEMSQGSGANKEWVELLVVDDGTDMREWELGDNDDGVWSSLVTFTTNAAWSSVSAGTLIVVYNGGDVDGMIVGADTDFGDNVVVIPHDNTTYFSDTGAWPSLGAFANSDADDAAAIRDAADAMVHDMAVAHPTATVTAPGSASAKWFIEDSVGEVTTSGNWSSGASTAGTPGVGNGGNNTTWISTLQGGGGPTTNVRFTAASASIGEDGVSYTVTVYKTVADGNVSGEVALSGTATEGGGADFTVDTTNFTMNGATTSATFVVTVNDDVDAESGETVILTLANLVGGSVSAPSTFTLTITDNDGTSSGLMISQYTETDIGSTPKGIEVWNNTGSAINFDSSANKLDVKVGANGGAPASAVTVETGSLAAGDVLVIGTSDMTPDVEEAFTYNGNDAIVLEFGGVVVDMFGLVGSNPGSAWTGGGLSTANRNLQLKSTVTAGDADGWTDPSERFEDVDVGSVLTGFGTPPGGAVAPTTNVQFTAASASIGEGGVSYTVTVYKTQADGNVSGEVALSGTATEGGGADYTVDTTNFTMNGATTSATFVVTVNDDAEVESGETVVLTLANVAGGTVASPSVFTLTISDNDVAPEVPEGMAAFRFTAGPHLQVSTKDANITVSDVSLTAGGIETNVTTGAYFPNEPYVEETAGWTADSQGSAKAYQFTITPDVGYSVTITGISFRAYASGAGPSAVGYTIGGVASYATDAADSVLVVVSQAVTGVDNQTSPILVQIQGWTNGTRSTSGGGIMKLDDVVVFGTITSGSGYSQEQEDYIVGYWGSVGAYTGDDLDDDGDGFNNVEEFVARTIPVLPNGATSYFRNVSIAASTRTVGYPSVTGRQYRLWGSTNLIPGIDWTQVAGPQVGDGLSQSLQEGVATTSSVFRLTVELTNP